MKILQLSPRSVFPPDDGGKIGIANISRELNHLGAEITLFYYYNDESELNNYIYNNELLELLPYKHSTENTLFRIIKSFLTNRSIYICKHINDEVKEFFRNYLLENHFDIIHVDHSAMAPLGLYIQSLTNVPIALRLHNIEYTIWERYAKRLSKLDPRYYFIKQQAILLKSYEKKMYPKMDVCFAITEEDLKLAKQMSPSANIVLASAGVNLSELKPDKQLERNIFTLIHATNYKWIHNTDALMWFSENVLSKLSEKYPEIKLDLLGKDLPDSLASSSNFINPIGYVPSIIPYMSKAGIYIAPLFVGGGIRIKILEAMALGLPIVASPIAAEGIKAKEKDGLFIAKNAEDFIKYISYLIDNPVTSAKLGEAAREFIIKHYAWEQNVKIMFDIYKQLVDKYDNKHVIEFQR